MSKLFVTKPTLNSRDSFISLLKDSWDTGILTHNGPLVKRYEKELESKLNVDRFISCTNGTIALQMALKQIKQTRSNKKNVIVPAFTWIASVSAIYAEGFEPIYCDVSPDDFNVDLDALESTIKDSRSIAAILPVHVFGQPCRVGDLEKLSQKYDIPIIYDAAHAVGAEYDGKSVLEFGHISCTSLHATKLINSGEGGGCITNDLSVQNDLEEIRFFGHNKKGEIVRNGFNGKMTEIHAALGISNLELYERILEDRKRKYLLYKDLLCNLEALDFQKINESETNYSYFPVLFENEKILLAAVDLMKNKKIFPRRYFYPSVNLLEKDSASCPVSENLASRIICLPLYFDLKDSQIESICSTIRHYLR